MRPVKNGMGTIQKPRLPCYKLEWKTFGTIVKDEKIEALTNGHGRHVPNGTAAPRIHESTTGEEINGRTATNGEPYMNGHQRSISPLTVC